MTRTPETSRYDLAIIGAGSGGMAAARRAAASGMKVVVFEAAHTGGTCVNAGCVPKKLMVHASRMADHLREMPVLGWKGGETNFDWKVLRDAVEDEVRRLSDYHANRLENLGIALISERAMITSPTHVTTASGTTVEASHILIATGARPVVPDIPGSEFCITSDDIFTLNVLPDRLAIIGGGYIAVEFACMMQRFGVEVTLFERGDRLIAAFDSEISELLRKTMTAQGIDVRLGASVDAVRREGDAYALNGKTVSGSGAFGQVLMAAGRAPNTQNIGLEQVDVQTTDRGHVVVDRDGRSSIPTIFAAGDVSERMALTPVAVRGGRRVVDILAGSDEPLTGSDIVPTAAFTTPECASVGLTEVDAIERGKRFTVRRTSFSPLASLLQEAPSSVFMKCLVENDTGRLLGFHFFGPAASEAAQLGAVALSAGLTEDQLRNTMALHPSVAEEVLSLGHPDEPIHQKVEQRKRAAA
ncbi:MAG: FAD-dependent oxidoreductase [Pseudomonadota bacterium]